ncbi:MAG: biotin--[acetyl-CoA-carboxylase] ligase [Bacteroidia bacterium]|nr:MAG: biotin--[acetyl-CoA-carboxylase] ligase [Bacteroidia bacterium]
MKFEKKHLTQIDSTNNYAKQNLEKVNIPTIIYADFQTNGRGQQNNVWYSEPSKNLLCSIVLPLYLPIQYNNYISRWTAIVLVEFLKNYIDEPLIKIKWPNDLIIYTNKEYKKIAGILIENNIEHKLITKTIIGIGLNVNQTEFGIFNKIATSIALITAQTYPISLLINSLENIISNLFPLLTLQQFENINRYYINHLYGWQHEFFYKEKDTLLKGKIIGLSDDGKITIKTTNHQIHNYENKQIQFIL